MKRPVLDTNVFVLIALILFSAILTESSAVAEEQNAARVTFVPYNAAPLTGVRHTARNTENEGTESSTKLHGNVSDASDEKSANERENEGRIIHLLNRMTFGTTLKDIATVKTMGINAYIEQQLHPQSIQLTDDLKEISHYTAMSQSPAYLYENYARPRLRAANEAQKFPDDDQVQGELKRILEVDRRLNEDFSTAHIARAAFSPAQLQEVMTDFWFNHFNIALSKNGYEEVWVGAYEETAIRPFALGKFRALLGATAHHAAMINYLDNRLNTAPHSPLANGEYQGINENYARELMELHTLGVDGGYTQKDVQELARILTGLGLPPNLFGPNVPKTLNQNRFRSGANGIASGAPLQPQGRGIWVRPGYDQQWQRAAELQQYARNNGAARMQLVEEGEGMSPTQSRLPNAQQSLQIQEDFGSARINLQEVGKLHEEPDVQEVRQAIFDNRFGTYFDQRRHDFGTKILLGHKITGKGEEEIEEALDILSRQPATAHHISFELAQYFLADKPPASLVKKLEAKFMDSDGDIPAVLNVLFHSAEFWDTRYINAKFKSPYRYLISCLRATDSDLGSIGPNLAFLKQLGEPLFQCLTPDGYKNTKDTWLNPDGLLCRINLADALGSGHYAGAQPQMRDPAGLEKCIGPNITERTRTVVAKSPENLRMTLLLGSPEFMRY
jgi:uncharacterized protein (DUF1800 family)